MNQKGFCFNSLQTGKHIQSLSSLVVSRASQYRFNSLQTGKHIQSGNEHYVFLSDFMFQFPSNGKAYPKFREHDTWREGESFNSLQTGKHIQSWNIFPSKPAADCFNSLQTGKHIQRKQKSTCGIYWIDSSFNSLQTGKHIQRD